MMKKSVSEEEFVKFFEDNTNKFNLNVLDDNQLNLDTIAQSCGKNNNGIESGDVLKYIYNNLETKGKFNASYNFNLIKGENGKTNIAIASSEDEFTYRAYCKDLVQRIAAATTDLTDIFNSNQKTRKPWWQHFIFVFSALTCTGIYWIIAGCQNKNGASDIMACLLPFDVSITINNMTEKIGKLGFNILLGVLNALFLVLFVCSLVFSWTIFAQVIFGVATFQFAILPILFSIIQAKQNFQLWREEQTKNKIKGQANKIYDWLDQTRPKEELLKNQKTNLNLYDNSACKQIAPMLGQQSFETNKNEPQNT